MEHNSKSIPDSNPDNGPPPSSCDPIGGQAGFMRWAAMVVAMAMAAFQLYTAYTVVFSPMIQRSVHLGFAIVLVFLMIPAGRQGGVIDSCTRILAAVAGAITTGYAAVEFTAPEILRVVDPTLVDLILGSVLTLLVLEATRRAAGLSLAVVSLCFFFYSFIGPLLPGLLGHPGFSYARIISTMYIRLEGIFGTATGTSATYIYIFAFRCLHDADGGRGLLPGAS